MAADTTTIPRRYAPVALEGLWRWPSTLAQSAGRLVASRLFTNILLTVTLLILTTVGVELGRQMLHLNRHLTQISEAQRILAVAAWQENRQAAQATSATDLDRIAGTLSGEEALPADLVDAR